MLGKLDACMWKKEIRAYSLPFAKTSSKQAKDLNIRSQI